MKNIYTASLENIEIVAHNILNNLTSKTVFFKGEMGAGKTTLIGKIISVLGAKVPVSSPTFSLVNEYETQNGLIYHFDLYRIKSDEEALDIGIEDYLNSQCWVFIEWPNKIKNLWPEHYNLIEIETLDFNTRKITITS